MQLSYWNTQKATGFINRTTDLFCVCSFCFVLLIYANFFAVPAQLRRAMTKFLVYLTTGTARRKILFLSFTEFKRGPLSSAPNCFSFCWVSALPRIIDLARVRSLLLAKFSSVWPLPDRKVPIQVRNPVLKRKENERETGNEAAT